MTMLVVGLYDQRSEADKVIRALKDAGFHRSQMERIEKKEKSGEGFFKSLFSTSDDEPVGVDDLREMGISQKDARFYAQAVRDGRVLLTTRCGEDETERVRQIMGRYRLSDYGRGSSQKPARDGATEPESQPETGSTAMGPDDWRAGSDYTGHEVQEEFIQDEPVVSREQSQEKEQIDDRTEAVTNGESLKEARIEELYRLSEQDRGRFEQFEPDLRTHYDEFYGADEEGFESFDRGYRYGMALAEYEPYRGLNWAEVEPEAEEGWETYNKGTWHRFRAAVEYGWNRIRGEHDERWPLTPP